MHSNYYSENGFFLSTFVVEKIFEIILPEERGIYFLILKLLLTEGNIYAVDIQCFAKENFVWLSFR